LQAAHHLAHRKTLSSRNTHQAGGDHLFFDPSGRNNDYWQPTQDFVRLHVFQHRITVHFRHEQVKDNRVGPVFMQEQQGLCPAVRLK
jgi:hypothetical protein